MSIDASRAPLLELRDVTKRFGAVTAVAGVQLTCHAGEVVALVGENGAGKSTLMKIISGVHRPDSGTVLIDGEVVELHHPGDARRRKIAIIHQELNLLPHRTVAQNVWLGREPRHLGAVRRREMTDRTRALLERLRVAGSIDPDALVHTLSVASQQMVEIARALSEEAELLIMDEPTSALSGAESATLFEIIDRLRSDGVGVIYISHRMEEVLRLSDRIVVLRDGRRVCEWGTSEVAELDIVRAMVGRELDDYYPPAANPEDIGECRLSLVGAANSFVGPIDLVVRAGEIVGVGGLEGAGKQQLAESIFGLTPFKLGECRVNDRPKVPLTPRQAIAAGIGYVTADRKGDGLVLGQSVLVNGEMTARATSGPASVRAELPGLLARMGAKFDRLSQQVSDLSGGNQQKVVLAKWMSADVDILILHEPTRGIDVAAKADIHNLLRELARQGMAVLMISSDLPELLGASDRIVVMRDGQTVGEFTRGATEADLMGAATGTRVSVAEAS